MYFTYKHEELEYCIYLILSAPDRALFIVIPLCIKVTYPG